MRTATGPKTRRERGGRREDRRTPTAHVVKAPNMVQAAQARAQEAGRVLVVHSGASWNSGGGGQRPQQIAEEFEREACVVHLNYGNPRRIKQPVVSTVVTGMAGAEQWFRLQARHCVLYSSFPDAALWNLLAELPTNWAFWYDCVDDWGDFEHNSWFSVRREQAVARRADLLTATSHYLVEHLQRMEHPAVEAHFLPNSTRLLDQPVPAEREPEFDCVFVGWMADNWFDWELVQAVLDAGYSVRLIGKPPREGRPFEHPALDWRGEVPNTRLREELACARVGLVPFRDMPLVHAVWPIKYADYLAAGMPTVAAHIHELRGAAYCAVTDTTEEFLAAIGEAVNGAHDRAAIMQAAAEHTAGGRVAQAQAWLREVGAW